MANQTRTDFLAFVARLPSLPTTLMASLQAPQNVIQRQVYLFIDGRWRCRATAIAIDDGHRCRLRQLY